MEQNKAETIKFGLALLAGVVAFIAFLTAVRGCQESDNQLRHEAFAHGCSLIAQAISCPVIK